ncbi:unnamed protein product [Rotaria sordida]|uniref:Receptor for retinol uptake STRA6 n=1 Tax=Rotaria sordida TaxID=392033 RepID=A0A814Q6R4_9BILA|nr:unnamed protein product [Rotaria sordida]
MRYSIISLLVSRFRCPKGWKHVGGSCYYLSNLTSTSTTANNTCNHFHSNFSNLIQIQNIVELFYIAHVLKRNNLLSLMFSIDPKLLKKKNFIEILNNDRDQWKQMKQKFHTIHMKYLNLTTRIINRLNSIDLHIMRRSKKVKQYKSNETTTTNVSFIVNNDNDEYEYDDLDSSDENDEFQKIEDIHNICNHIDSNVLNDNSTVYILTTYILSNKTICLLSDVELNIKYHHICEYVLDFCFANIICGKHGHCVNTLSGFKCSCSFLYGGLLCDKISQQGQQILISVGIIIILYGISFIPIQRLLRRSNKHRESLERKDDNKNQARNQHYERNSKSTMISIRNIWVALLSIFILSSLLILITLRYYKLFKIDKINDENLETSMNDTIHLIRQCEKISDYRKENIIFFPFALTLIFIFSWSIKREKKCLHTCDGRPGLLPPIVPFGTRNRFITAAVFGIIVYAVLKIFEELLFGLHQTLNHGVLIELFIRILTSIILGLRYYPVVASLQLRHIIVRFLTFIYVLCDIVYTIVREGSCMGFLPLSGQYTVLEETKLRVELGSWFIIYGLIKNIPHFFFLAYISAELCMRFVYDSIYVSLKTKQSIWLVSNVEFNELKYSKYYVTKLLRRNRSLSQIITQQNVTNQSRLREFFNFFFYWDDSFRFTTIATCTYTVAFTFLYYLACTFVFLYTSRSIGHISFIRSYIEYSANVEINEKFSLKREIILSAIFTAILYGYQLCIGMQKYKKHKLQLNKGIYSEIPSEKEFKLSSIASNSVHYSGFLVGYMAWGFVICFHLILLILIGIRILTFQIRYIELVLAIIVPILVIYLLKMLSMRSAGKFLFIQNLDNKRKLECGKIYAIFLYFSFFADCFLGIASCIIRLIKATFLNIVYMARLDYSFFGRPLEKFDVGFAAYTSYLHVEKQYTHPVMLAFCDLLLDMTYRQTRKYCNQEYSRTRNDFNVENRFKKQRENPLTQKKKTSSLQTNRLTNKNHESIQFTNDKTHNFNSTNTSLSIHDSNSSFYLIHEMNATKVKYNSTDNKSRLSIAKNMPKTKLQNLSTTYVSSKFTISNNEIKIDKNNNSSTQLISSTLQQQQSLSQLSKININNRINENKDNDLSKQTEKNKQELKTKNNDTSKQQSNKDKSFDTTQSSKYQQDVTSTSYDIINEMKPKISDTIENTKTKKSTKIHPQDTILIEEKVAISQTTTTINPSLSNLQNLYKNNLYSLQTMSYNETQHNSQVDILEQSNDSSLLYYENDINNDDIDLTNNRIQTGIFNRIYSIIESIPLLSNHSNTQLSEQILTKQSNTNKNITIENEKEKKRKIARNRWYLAYTIIYNSHLFNLRKCLIKKRERIICS